MRGYPARKPDRLQLQLEVSNDYRVSDIVVAEDERAVVAFATVCTSTGGDVGLCARFHGYVYLERPLAGAR